MLTIASPPAGGALDRPASLRTAFTPWGAAGLTEPLLIGGFLAGRTRRLRFQA